MRILVTGGCGFIGSAVVRHIIYNTKHQVLNIDALTYSASLESVVEVSHSKRYQFQIVNILNKPLLENVFEQFRPEAIMHLAAESHVDRSIDSPEIFIQTNIVGTYTLLSVAFQYWKNLSKDEKDKFRFHHISTDEVFGALHPGDKPFNEQTPYDPRSPYSASKAGSDHLVRSWYHTYGLPTFVTNTTNNYGYWHFPEKLIPLTIINALEEKTIPVYGKGENVRDWLFVEDHAEALVKAVEQGKPGDTYAIGARQPRTNLQLVQTICSTLDELKPRKKGKYGHLIEFVTDRPGHDFRYEIDPTYAEKNFQWQAKHNFEKGVYKTVQWYLEHRDWWQKIRKMTYDGKRLGLN